MLILSYPALPFSTIYTFVDTKATCQLAKPVLRPASMPDFHHEKGLREELSAFLHITGLAVLLAGFVFVFTCVQNNALGWVCLISLVAWYAFYFTFLVRAFEFWNRSIREREQEAEARLAAYSKQHMADYAETEDPGNPDN